MKNADRMRRPRGEIHTRFMKECISLAVRGRGSVEPNPLVGAVVVKRGRIIGKGYHRKFGGPHAEIHALRSCRQDPRGATLYVNLEPCVHYGKTPPCSDAIRQSGIKDVVVGMTDPNSLVAGRGIRKLRKSGIRVKTNVLRDECRKLNECYIKHVTTGMPFVTLKIAQSIDGRVAKPFDGTPWITGEIARKDVHRRRSEIGCVLVGAGTVRRDNPRLTVRHVRGRQPVRVILDGRMTVDSGARVFAAQKSSPTILIITSAALRRHSRKAGTFRRKGITVVAFDTPLTADIPVAAVLRVLGTMGFTSILVEGGPKTWASFLHARCADKIILYTAPAIYGGGPAALAGIHHASILDIIGLADISIVRIGEDHLLEGYLTYKKRRK